MAESSDERWRACQDLGTLGPTLSRHPEACDDIYNLLKETLHSDPSSIVRYHSAIALGKIAPFLARQRPDMVFDITNLVCDTATKDPYDRVRRGAAQALSVLGEMHSKRPELGLKVRECAIKILAADPYDVMRCDACSLVGKMGPPNTLAGKAMLEEVVKAQKEDSSNLVRILASIALVKSGKDDKMHLGEPVKQLEKLIHPQIGTLVHWSYWSHRECMARGLSDMGPLLTYQPEVLDNVLSLLEILIADSMWDVRLAACKAYREFAPVNEAKPASRGSLMRPASRGRASTVAIIPSSTEVTKGLEPTLRTRSVPVLQKATKDLHADVRAAAVAALAVRQGRPFHELTRPRT